MFFLSYALFLTSCLNNFKEISTSQSVYTSVRSSADSPEGRQGGRQSVDLSFRLPVRKKGRNAGR